MRLEAFLNETATRSAHTNDTWRTQTIRGAHARWRHRNAWIASAVADLKSGPRTMIDGCSQFADLVMQLEQPPRCSGNLALESLEGIGGSANRRRRGGIHELSGFLVR